MKSQLNVGEDGAFCQVSRCCAVWRVANGERVLEAGGLASPPFALRGLGSWTMELSPGFQAVS